MIHTQDQDFTLLCGDVLDELAGLPDESVHCVVTSPPYWGLRDYGTGSWDGGDPDCDHKAPPSGGPNPERYTPGGGEMFRAANDKLEQGECRKCGARRVDQQLGLEPTPEAYVARMVEVFREVRRVLRADGTCWVNLGDSYASGDGLGRNDAGRNFTGGGGNIEGSGNPGRQGKHERTTGLKAKDLCGIPWRVAFALQADGWYLRSDIIWAKPNPMPESVTDRPTKSHEYVFLLSKGPRYFFDQEAVREPATYYGPNGGPDTMNGAANARPREMTGRAGVKPDVIPGRNIRSVWDIATQPYPEAHFATYPEELVRRCVLAGSPEDGTVLDPFLGSGTTAYVARKHGRKSIGIELNPAYADLAAKRMQQQSLLV